MPYLKTTPGGYLLHLHVTPRAKRNGVEGLHGSALKVKIKAPPVDGKANAYLIGFLAETLDLPKAAVSVVHGETSREKTVRVAGRTEAEIRSRLGR